MKFRKLFEIDEQKAYSSKRHFYRTYEFIRKEFNDSVNDFLDNQAMRISVISIEDNNKKSISHGKGNPFWIKAKCDGFLYKEELKLLLKNPYFAYFESVCVRDNNGNKKYENTFQLQNLSYNIEKISSIGNGDKKYFYMIFNELASLSYSK